MKLCNTIKLYRVFFYRFFFNILQLYNRIPKWTVDSVFIVIPQQEIHPTSDCWKTCWNLFKPVIGTHRQIGSYWVHVLTICVIMYICFIDGLPKVSVIILRILLWSKVLAQPREISFLLKLKTTLWSIN